MHKAGCGTHLVTGQIRGRGMYCDKNQCRNAAVANGDVHERKAKAAKADENSNPHAAWVRAARFRSLDEMEAEQRWAEYAKKLESCILYYENAMAVELLSTDLVLGDAQRVAAEARRLLRPGGIFVLISGTDKRKLLSMDGATSGWRQPVELLEVDAPPARPGARPRLVFVHVANASVVEAAAAEGAQREEL